MLDVVMSVLPTIVVLGVLIAIHEWGHYIVAKLSGVNVEKFSIGFGPELIKFQKKETEYVISLIPLGGFVKMAGDTYEERQDGILQEGDYLATKLWKRFLIVFAGPFMNYVLAFFLLFIVYLGGTPHLTSSVGSVLKDSPAYENGLQEGDRILQMNGQNISKWEEMTDLIQESQGEVIDFVVEREGQEVAISFAAKETIAQDIFGEEVQTYQVGISSSGEIIYEENGFLGSITGASKQLWTLTTLTAESIIRLVTGRLSLKVMSGPLGIIDMANKTAKQGIMPLLQLMAYLSVFLCVFNLFPFPALDGGHILFMTLEAIRRKPVSFAVQEKFAQVGFLLLIGLMIVVLYNDMDRFGWIENIKNLFLNILS